MKKLISAVTSLCVAATMVGAVAPISSGAAESKGFTIKTYDGASSTIDCSDGDVVVPCAIYLSEDTANTSSVQVAASFVSGPDVAKVKITNVVDFASDYYSAAQTFTKADGSTFETTLAPAWVGSFSRKGAYQGEAGSYNGSYTKADSMTVVGADYAYVGAGWINSDGSYEYTGATADAYPFLIFEVTFPQGTADGEYTIDFVRQGNDSAHPENSSSMIESSSEKFTEANGNLTLTPLTITVGDGGSETVTTTAPATTTQAPTTTTTAGNDNPDVADADIIIDLGSYTVPSGGGDVEMNITMDPKGNVLTSVSAYMAADSEIVWDGMESKSEAFGSSIVINDDAMKFNFPTLNGSDGKTCDAGATIATIYWIVPDTTPDGVYHVTADKFEVMNNTDVYKVAVINGDITVGEGGEVTTTEAPTTTTEAPATTTTAAPTTTQAPTTTTQGTVGDVLYGDSNCDGVVNVADVVVLNKWLNDNTSYNLTEQGKVNADCYNEKGGADLTTEDSLAIIQSIVHLVTLPTTTLAK